MKVICSKCNYEWNYKGKSTYWATCPMCRKNIKLEVKENVKQEAT